MHALGCHDPRPLLRPKTGVFRWAALSAACCPLVAGCSPSFVGGAEPAGATNAVIVRVIDGDTADLRQDDRGRLRIRILGINAPETHRKGWSVGCQGPESAAWATSFLPVGQWVSVVCDPTQDATDRYGRTLAYIGLPDGRDFSTECVRAGMSKVVTDELAAAEAVAKDQHTGLWAASPAATTRVSSPATERAVVELPVLLLET
jgi:micrococcal nuclease